MCILLQVTVDTSYHCSIYICLYITHYYFTRLNPKKKGPFQFCLPALLGIHRHPMKKEFFRSTKGFLRAALTGHGHPGPLLFLSSKMIISRLEILVHLLKEWLVCMMKDRSYNTFLLNKARYFIFPNLDKAASIILYLMIGIK